MRIEVAYATPDEQVLIELDVSEGSTVEQAIDASAIYDRFPSVALKECEVGIWGRRVARSDLVKSGDRVELYRPLKMSPREARRLRAKAAG